VILVLSSLPELVEKTVLSLVKYITACARMLSDSYKGIVMLQMSWHLRCGPAKLD